MMDYLEKVENVRTRLARFLGESNDILDNIETALGKPIIGNKVKGSDLKTLTEAIATRRKVLENINTVVTLNLTQAEIHLRTPNADAANLQVDRLTKPLKDPTFLEKLFSGERISGTPEELAEAYIKKSKAAIQDGETLMSTLKQALKRLKIAYSIVLLLATGLTFGFNTSSSQDS